MVLHRISGVIAAGFLGCVAVLVSSSCGGSPGGGGGSAGSGGTAGTGGSSGSGACGTTPADDDYAGCATCQWSSSANPDESMCTTSRSVNACCDWVQAPTTALARSTGLHYYSATSDVTVDYSCLATAPTAGAVHTSTLSGYVKIFSSGTDTAGVMIQVFNVDTSTGALGAQVGSTYTTSSTDKSVTNNWLNACTTNVCTFREYTITGVPTETPLVIVTSDAGMGGGWSSLYDYNIYFSDADVCASAPAGAPCVASTTTWATSYDVTAVKPCDISTAAISVGLTTDPTKGVLAGEVHDCGDIRISGADVDTDQPHIGSLFYFGAQESDPLPNETLTSTSPLGLFGALNLAPGVPIRVSAIGTYAGKDTLLGTNVVQVYTGSMGPAVTAISLRGRRPYQ
jgi:hypothetical protein